MARSRSRSRKRRSRSRSSRRRVSYRPASARRRRSRSRSKVRFGQYLRKGTLGKYGYKVKYSTQQRREALKRAALAEGYLPIFRKLIAVSTLQKNRSPGISGIMRSDAEWVRANYKY